MPAQERATPVGRPSAGRRLIIPAAVVAIAVAGLAIWSAGARSQRGADAAVGSSPAQSAEIERLRAEVRALRNQVGAVAVAVNTNATSAPAAAAAVTPPPRSKPRLTDEQIREQEVTHARRVAGYASAYLEREVQDAGWGPAREREIEGDFKTLTLAGFSFRAAECRATICRAVIDRSPEGIPQELGPAVADFAAFKKMGAFFHYEADKVTVYSPREGHPFPNDPALVAEQEQGQEQGQGQEGI